jgi:hypothetical protein
MNWTTIGAGVAAWGALASVLLGLGGCVRNDYGREPYDPNHSAADRYGQRSKFVDGLFWRDICEGAGGEWSNGPNGKCSVFPFERPSIGEPNS